MEEQKKDLSEEKQEQHNTPHKRHSSGNAAHIDAIITSPTQAVHRRHSTGSSYASTGTNISYEGATAPGSGGSAGTGYASGKEATGSRISADSGNDRVHPHTNNQNQQEQNEEQEEEEQFIGAGPEDTKGDEPMDDDEIDDADETDDTMGIP